MAAYMVNKRSLYLTLAFIIEIILMRNLSSCFHLNIDELKNVHYGLDIINEPLVKGQIDLPHSVYLSSRHGQEYVCTYQNQADNSKQKEQEERVAMETGIPQLLHPMQSEPCLKKTVHWWTYEFCYAKHVLQYHIEGDAIQGQVLKLGLYESQFDWSNDTAQGSFLKTNRLNRYHSQRYANGTTCDETKKPRMAEVRFECEHGTGDYIHRVDEPWLCSYIVTVRTTKICHHPYLRPPTQLQSVSIKCNPVLSRTDYQVYSRLKQDHEKQKYSSNKNPTNQNVDPSSDKITDIPKKDQDIERTEVVKDSGTLGETDKADADVVKEFDAGVDKITDSKDRVAREKMTDTIQKSAKEEFKEIVKEAQEEVGVTPEEMDAHDAMHTLGKTLSKLMKRLEDKEKDLKDADESVVDEEAKKDAKSRGETKDLSDRVQIRIQKIPTGKQSDGTDDGELGENSDHHTHKLTSSQADKIRESYRDENKKRRVSEPESKIRVEIISSAYIDESRGEVHILSSADSKAIKKAINSLLTDTSDADDETRRQNEQETAYQYNWKRRITKSSKPRTDDADL